MNVSIETIDLLEGIATTRAIRRFTTTHRNHGPEDICDSGTRP